MSVNLSVVYILRAKSHFLETLAKLKTGITKQSQRNFLVMILSLKRNYSSSD